MATSKKGTAASGSRNQILLVAFLSIVLLLILGRNVVSSMNTGKAAAEPASGDPPPAVAIPAAPRIAWQKPPPPPPDLPDPMRLRASAEPPGDGEGAAGSDDPAAGTGEIEVTGVVYTEARPSAIVGGKIIHAGDVVGGATVRKIEKGSVEFERDGVVWVVPVRVPRNEQKE